jgi:Thrombospondin type 1 domain
MLFCMIGLVDGEWGPWGEWSECSKQCDTGIQQRHRVCNRPQFGGTGCIGDSSQMKKCNLTPCKGIIHHQP